MPGADIVVTVYGRPHHYTTVTPCAHDWWHDDPYESRWLAAADPVALAAFDRGYRLGQAELDEMSGGQLGAPSDDPTLTAERTPQQLEVF